MKKMEMPLDGSDPNDPKSGQGSGDEDPALSTEVRQRKGAGQIAGETVQSGVKNTVNAVKNSGGDVKKAATEAVGKTAGDAAKNIAGDVAPGAAEAASKVAEIGSKAVGTIAAVKGAAAAAVKAGGIAVALIIDPITWIVIAVIAVIIIIIIGIVAGVQVIGKTDNADGCYGIGVNQSAGGGGSLNVNVQSSADKMATATTIADWAMTTKFGAFGGQPMTREQATGLIGNMWQESQMNPAASQSSSISANSSNADVMALGKKNGGKAIGIIQWDSDRRYYFAQYAESKGKHWSDLGVQLEFMFLEIEGTAVYPDGAYSHGLLVKSGFPKAGESVEFYTEKWEKSFTRAGEPQLDKRINYANTFNSSYSPGSGAAFSSSSSGGSCLSSNLGDSPVASETVALAIQIAYPTIPESRTGSDQLGTSKAKPEYIKAKEQAEQLGSKDWYEGLYASCDRAVATVVINTMDQDFPWGNIVEQRKYMDKSSKWTQYTSISEAKAGDVWVTKPSHDGGGHIVMYLGNVNGKDMIMHASYSSRGNSRVAGLQERKTYISDSMTDKGGRGYYGYRFTG